jgi:hypothetical protein
MQGFYRGIALLNNGGVIRSSLFSSLELACFFDILQPRSGSFRFFSQVLQ